MARKKVYVDIKENIIPMKPDAMNPPEFFCDSQDELEKKSQICLCQTPSDTS